MTGQLVLFCVLCVVFVPVNGMDLPDLLDLPDLPPVVNLVSDDEDTTPDSFLHDRTLMSLDFAPDKE